jgi:hypothetical protein
MMANRNFMNNFYYYFFYTVALFAKRVNKRDKDYSFSSLMFVSLCMGLNILSVIFLLKKFTSLLVNTKLIILIMALIVL